MSAAIADVTEATYDQEVGDSSVPVLVDFWAPWCGPCKALLPTLEALAPMYDGRLKFVKINADADKGIAEKFGVRALPTLLLVKDRGQSVTALYSFSRTRLAMELDEFLATEPSTTHHQGSPISMHAFQGDAALKQKLIDSVRRRWIARELLPCPVLIWDPKAENASLSGALVQSQDRDVFEASTGIPTALAMCCEGLIHLGMEVDPDPSRPGGRAIDAGDSLLSFGLQWLEAIRPGADLSDVVPRFMVHFVGKVLATDFALAEHIEPDVRAALEVVLRMWCAELNGETVDPNAWRAARGAAVAATAGGNTPWCFPVAQFTEALAWPVREVAAEFVPWFLSLARKWMDYLSRPVLSEEERADQVHDLIGRELISRAGRKGELDGAATEALLNTLPETHRAMMAFGDPIALARMQAARRQARVLTDPALREQMDVMLRLIAAA